MTTLAPYARIAAELRERITSGSLAPGARVLSTRQIARRWDVALATATKALAMLLSEGLIVAQPRVGHVVAPRRPPPRVAPRAAEPELTPGRIVEAALAIADQEGIDALSMRAVAARLGVGTMSLYRHVTSKEDLITWMADAAFGEVTYPSPAPTGWRPRLEVAGRLLWDLFKRHPWLAGLQPITRPILVPNLLTHAEWALSSLDHHGLSTTEIITLHALLWSFLQGVAVNIESELRAAAATGLTGDEWMSRTQLDTYESLMATGRYPTFERVTRILQRDRYDLELDLLFEEGLAALLDGLALRLDRPTARRTRRAT